MDFWRIFQVFGIVSAWSVKALADGKITLVEAAELGLALGTLLGIPTNVTIPGAPEVAELTDANPDADAPTSETEDQRIPLHGPAGETGTDL